MPKIIGLKIRFENIDTKTKKTTISSALNGEAEFSLKSLQPSVVKQLSQLLLWLMKSANLGELVMFTTRRRL